MINSFISTYCKNGQVLECSYVRIDPVYTYRTLHSTMQHVLQTVTSIVRDVLPRVRALTGNRENNPVPAVSMWSEEEEQGGGRGRAWQRSLPVNAEDSVCSEPHLEVDTEEDPKTVSKQENRLT